MRAEMQGFSGSHYVEMAGTTLLIFFGVLAGFFLHAADVPVPYLALFPPIVIICKFFGFRQAMIAELFCGVFSWYVFVDPKWSFALPTFGDGVQLVAFLLFVLFVCGVIESQRQFIRSLEKDLARALDATAPTIGRDTSSR